jgi:hypothetical protein
LKNGTSPVEDMSNLGQLFDHVYHLKTYSGWKHAFGMLVTYHQWRVVWLPEDNDVAESTAITFVDMHQTSIMLSLQKCQFGMLLCK